MRIISDAIVTYDDLRRELQRRRQHLGVTSREFDDAAGLAAGHMSKLECGMRGFGAMSLPTVLSALGLRLALVEAPDGLPSAMRIAVAQADPGIAAKLRARAERPQAA
jgi:transcriptional regulator with XRE-family HTH domain